MKHLVSIIMIALSALDVGATEQINLVREGNPDLGANEAFRAVTAWNLARNVCATMNAKVNEKTLGLNRTRREANDLSEGTYNGIPEVVEKKYRKAIIETCTDTFDTCLPKTDKTLKFWNKPKNGCEQVYESLKTSLVSCVQTAGQMVLELTNKSYLTRSNAKKSINSENPGCYDSTFVSIKYKSEVSEFNDGFAADILAGLTEGRAQVFRNPRDPGISGAEGGRTVSE